MKTRLLLVLVLLARVAFAESATTNAPTAKAPTSSTSAAKSPGKLSRSAQTAAQLQSALDQLTQTNHDLLDLLKKQQGVLEDMQFDRRLQSRQIQSLEERLEEALQEKNELENKVAKLQAEAEVRPSIPVVSAPLTGTTSKAEDAASSAVTNAAPATIVVPPPPTPPASYLPPEGGGNGPPGTMTWHRLFTLKGADTRQTDLFQIHGKIWRVLWHNQDPPGKAYRDTSGLFINAFPKDDTIPQRVCAKVGSGGDSTELQGAGNYYLKVEASGGAWELAVEDFR